MKNLKPFDLQAALSGKAVMLRDGRKAYVRHHETELDVSADYKLLGFVADGDQLSWHESGSYTTPSDTSCRDIIGMYPETRVINGFEVPAPEKDALALDTIYYTALTAGMVFHERDQWEDDPYDTRMLKRGLVFLNKEDAIATAKAMLGIDPYEGDE